MHKLTDKLITNQHQQQLPSDEDELRPANKFNDFFYDKIGKIRSNFNLNDDAVEESFRGEKLENIRPATIDEVKTLIVSHSNKSCELDPIPTWLLKECLDELLPLLTSIINNSLLILTGVFPEQCKPAIVILLLKKRNLEPEELRNYKLVSNLHFISKVIEKKL